jgi:formylglycine-generating enzyme required for sulfatase activity
MSYRTDVSPYGVHDLAGNAREWCRDNYKEDIYLESGQHGETLLRNPPVTKRIPTTKRAIRGNGPDWKAWHRSGENYKDVLPDVGFRCVLALAASNTSDDSESAKGDEAPKSTKTGGF